MIHRLKLLKAVQDEVDESRNFKANCHTLGLGNGPRIPMLTFVENRKRLIKKVSPVDRLGIIFVEGGKFSKDIAVNELDKFQQESFFFWMFGVLEPFYYGAIDVLDEKFYLFYPKFNGDGIKEESQLIKTKYLVDVVESEEEMLKTLSKFNRRRIFVARGKSSGSFVSYNTPYIDKLEEEFTVDCTSLYPILCELRATKTEVEKTVIRYVTDIATNGLRYVMSCLTSEMREFKGIALFSLYVSRLGSCEANTRKNLCLASSNVRRIVHCMHGEYNNGRIREGDMCILDLSCNYFGYNAAVGVTFPVSGKFSDDQKLLYNVVLDVREGILSHLGRGITLLELNKLGAKVLLQHLKFDFDLLNYSVEELLEAGVDKIFMPQTCCHLIGLEIEDVGEGDTAAFPEAVKKVASRCLGPGMILVVGPSCYFIDQLIDYALQDQLLKRYVRERTNDFRSFGGVILKDMVMITDSGYDILSDIPRSINDVEDFLQDTVFNLPRKSTRRFRKYTSYLQ